MNERDISNYLEAIVGIDDGIVTDNYDDEGNVITGFVSHTRSFEEDGVMTWNKGFTLFLESGEEFQISVVQSKRVYKEIRGSNNE